jgi:hypothetical protein
MNSELYDRKVKLPDTLKNHLSKSFESVESDANTEGHNRNQEIRESGILTYQQIKRIKNWFDKYDGDGKDAPFILNGGDRMKTWCDHVLNHWRSVIDSGKKVKADSGMSNQYIDSHDKDGIVVNPNDKHESGLNKFDTSVNEEIKRINKLIDIIK